MLRLPFSQEALHREPLSGLLSISLPASYPLYYLY